MAFEAEIKYTTGHAAALGRSLGDYGTPYREDYLDVYFAHSVLVPEKSDRELRVRTIKGHDGSRAFLTFKDEIIDAETRSKRELETEVADGQEMCAILDAAGFSRSVELEKHCVNWRFTYDTWPVLASLVRVPELPNTFLELESVVDQRENVPEALGALRTLACELGLSGQDETTGSYTDAVRQHRRVS